ncbi:MAG: hypothetical protein K2X53_01800 [Alphaproteobacteria bacterium]|nr:hypothetical protein [Alphaproteobacteria bacterium]
MIYLIGQPGTGKYTISQALAKKGYTICDNQLINNPIFALINYDGFTMVPERAWKAIAQVRNAVFDFLSSWQEGNFVLTNCLFENEGDRRCFLQVEAMAMKRGSLFMPVKLYISKEEHLRRIVEPSRRERWKSIDPNDVYADEPILAIQHPNLFELEVSELSPDQAAEFIIEQAMSLKNQSN